MIICIRIYLITSYTLFSHVSSHLNYGSVPMLSLHSLKKDSLSLFEKPLKTFTKLIDNVIRIFMRHLCQTLMSDAGRCSPEYWY